MTLIASLKNGPFTLSLSSGYFGFFAHCGFVKALEEENLIPELVTGSSAGAISGACVAAGIPSKDMASIFGSLNKSHYFDPAWGFGVLKGQLFEDSLAKYLPQDFSQLRIPLHIATFNILARKTHIFSEGPHLPKVVRASCAMPLFFHPVKIGSSYYWDGGILDKAGISGVTDSKNILCHYLKSDRVSDWFEFRKHAKNNQHNFYKYSFDNLPPTGPGKFHNGPEAIDIVYKQTKKALYEDGHRRQL